MSCFFFFLFPTQFLFAKATRPVTTFQSAHDTNGDKSISKFYWLNKKKKKESWDPLVYDDLCNDPRLKKKCKKHQDEKGKKKTKSLCGSMECQRAIALGDIKTIHDQCGGSENDCSECVTCNSAGDSIWSFHVWNDMFFSRPDLDGQKSSQKKKNSGGWQAVGEYF